MSLVAFSLNPVDWVTSAAGAVLGVAGDAFLDAVVGAIEDALGYIGKFVASQIAGLGTPDLESAAFSQIAGVFKWLALALLVATIMLGAVGSIVSGRAELADLVREIPVSIAWFAGWYVGCAAWFSVTRVLLTTFLGDAIAQGLESGLSLDASIAVFFRGIIALLMIIALLLFLIEVAVLGFIAQWAVIIGPLSIALRPWKPLRDVAARVVRNLVLFSLTPPLTAGAMALALRNMNATGALDIGQAIGSLGGLVVSILMPLLIVKFLPIGEPIGNPAKALLGAAVALGAAATTMGAAGAGAAAGAVGGSTGGGMSTMGQSLAAGGSPGNAGAGLVAGGSAPPPSGGGGIAHGQLSGGGSPSAGTAPAGPPPTADTAAASPGTAGGAGAEGASTSRSTSPLQTTSSDDGFTPADSLERSTPAAPASGGRPGQAALVAERVRTLMADPNGDDRG